MAEGPNDGEWQVGLATHEWNAAEDPVFTGLGTGHQGETPVGGCQGTEPSRRSQHPKARPWHRLHVGVQAEPRRTAGYVTRMPGGVGGVAPRGVPLSRSSAHLSHRAAYLMPADAPFRSLTGAIGNGSRGW